MVAQHKQLVELEARALTQVQPELQGLPVRVVQQALRALRAHRVAMLVVFGYQDPWVLSVAMDKAAGADVAAAAAEGSIAPSAMTVAETAAAAAVAAEKVEQAEMADAAAVRCTGFTSATTARTAFWMTAAS